MRRTTHTRTIALAALTLLLAGCGTQSGGDAGGSGTVSPSPTPSHPNCATAKGELGAADTGHTYCLAPGGTIRVSLDGTTRRPWAPVKTAGSGLEATNSGIVLQPGDASAAYRAVSAGTVRLTSSRPLCPSDPARVSCDGLQEWTVTVIVPKA
jgi:putative hemolysin